MKLCDRSHKSAINGALLNKLCVTKSLRSRSRLWKVVVGVVQIIPKSRRASGTVTPSTDHPDSSEDSGGSTSVVL